MKKLIAAGLLCIPFVGCDQGKDIPAMEVPSVVVNTLNTEFSNATDMEWETIGDNYQSEFEVKSVDHKALIGPKGALLKYTYEININDLPEKVIQAIKQNYPSEKVEDAYVLKIEDGTFYEIEFEGWLRDKHKVFTPTGTENKNIEHWE